MKSRANSNAIPMIQSEYDRVLVDQQDIKAEVIKFYRGLTGTTGENIPIIDQNIIRHGPKITLQRKDMCRAITREKVKVVVFNIDDNNASGIDGFSACFFTNAWQIILKDLFKGIKDFFTKIGG